MNQIRRLAISMAESYEGNAGQYQGHVMTKGDLGEQKLNLSPKAISRIFACVEEELAATALTLASSMPKAASDAVNAHALLPDLRD